ncbi:MAG: PadR family transcriptional regulator [Marinobacter sp.]|uniref:PadR family transcriptional regulator n=1 Tax=Marinobacter sp. TaxID=50741 RepID=UPI00299DE54E|nr:PadR family transcriptional regulator [Marinobacter sp.]MDX1634089.1 PadR family transcriptional regulator [Marinobacter sp.]
MALGYALLAALQDEPATGYELTQRFKTRLANVWNASHQQVYRELNRLARERCLQVKTINQSDKPDKKQYSVTIAGTRALKAWLEQPQARPPIRDPLQVKLFAGKLVDTALLADELDRWRQDAVAQLGYYRVIEHTYFRRSVRMDPATRLQYLALRRGMLAEEALLSWLEEAESTLEELSPDEGLDRTSVPNRGD